MPDNIEPGIYPLEWSLAKQSYEAINESYIMAGKANDKLTQLQLFGQWGLLRNELNGITTEGGKQCVSCGGYGHLQNHPCPTSKLITILKGRNAQFRTIIDAAEGAIERELGITKSSK